jgi:hypothetical protein
VGFVGQALSSSGIEDCLESFLDLGGAGLHPIHLALLFIDHRSWPPMVFHNGF